MKKNNYNDCGFHMLVNMTFMIQYFDRIDTSFHRVNDSIKVDQLTLDNHKFVENSARTLRLELEDLLICLSTRWIKEDKKVDFSREGFKLQSANPNVSKYIIHALYVS